MNSRPHTPQHAPMTSDAIAYALLGVSLVGGIVLLATFYYLLAM